jgi:23S rRNA pseudouridine2457 synthase
MTTLRFNKPYLTLCQFEDSDGRDTLSHYIDIKGVYAAGRLDRDSEGLLLLTDNGNLQHQIAHPDNKLPKTYWVQVDGDITREAMDKLKQGVELKDGKTRPAQVRKITEPDNLWPRDPPVRYRAQIPTSWIEIKIAEGKNRQIRRMTAAVGYPTLRLIRYAIGHTTLHDLNVGSYQAVDESAFTALLPTKSKVQSRAPVNKQRYHKRSRA